MSFCPATGKLSRPFSASIFSFSAFTWGKTIIIIVQIIHLHQRKGIHCILSNRTSSVIILLIWQHIYTCIYESLILYYTIKYKPDKLSMASCMYLHHTIQIYMLPTHISIYLSPSWSPMTPNVLNWPLDIFLLSKYAAVMNTHALRVLLLAVNVFKSA